MERPWRQRRLHILRQYRRSQSGVSAIEFALVAPLFFMLLIAIFEVGIMLFSEFTIQNNTSDASRMIRTGEVRNGGDFTAQVCGRLANFLDCGSNLDFVVQAFDDFDDVNEEDMSPPFEDGEWSDNWHKDGIGYFDPDAGKAGKVVLVRVYYRWSLFTPGMAYMMSNFKDDQRLLVGGAAFRNEPFGS